MMAVANAQIGELYQILRQFIGNDCELIQAFLKRLSASQAYQWNKSFRDTVLRLEAYHMAIGKERR